MSKEVERLQELIDQYDNIVFFGGAGVSTESGIPDFRSQDGLYNQKYDYPPETILSHTFFMRRPEEFFKFYRDKMLCDTANQCGTSETGRDGAGRKAESGDHSEY